MNPKFSKRLKEVAGTVWVGFFIAAIILFVAILFFALLGALFNFTPSNAVYVGVGIGSYLVGLSVSIGINGYIAAEERHEKEADAIVSKLKELRPALEAACDDCLWRDKYAYYVVPIVEDLIKEFGAKSGCGG